jgi:hypothetical protein
MRVVEVYSVIVGVFLGQVIIITGRALLRHHSIFDEFLDNWAFFPPLAATAMTVAAIWFLRRRASRKLDRKL